MSSVASLLMHAAKSTQALRTSFFGWGATTCSCARYNTVCASVLAEALVELDVRRLCWSHSLPCSVYVYFAVRWAYVPVDLQIYPEVLRLFVQLARTGHIQSSTCCAQAVFTRRVALQVCYSAVLAPVLVLQGVACCCLYGTGKTSVSHVRTCVRVCTCDFGSLAADVAGTETSTLRAASMQVRCNRHRSWRHGQRSFVPVGKERHQGL